MQSTTRIAIVGTENSHVDHIVDFLNVRRATPAARVVAIVGPESDRNRELMSHGSVAALAPTVVAALGMADALIVTDRHGGRHREHAEPFLAAGRPVWVDKPLACSLDEARRMVATAEESGALLTSYSAVRWVPDADELVRRLPELGDLQTVTITGPADPASEWGGIHFYGIHAADLAMRLVPGRPGPVRVERVADTVVAHYRVGDVGVTLQLVRPGPTGQVPFHASVVGVHGIESRELRLDRHYVDPGVEVFLHMLSDGTAPIPARDLLRPVGVLEQIEAALQ